MGALFLVSSQAFVQSCLALLLENHLGMRKPRSVISSPALIALFSEAADCYNVHSRCCRCRTELPGKLKIGPSTHEEWRLKVFHDGVRYLHWLVHFKTCAQRAVQHRPRGPACSVGLLGGPGVGTFRIRKEGHWDGRGMNSTVPNECTISAGRVGMLRALAFD